MATSEGKIYRLGGEMSIFGVGIFAGLLAVSGVARVAGASDWPQFMRGPERTGDAADEELKLPLGIIAQVKLDDMVTTSPAVVGGLVYVVDQMGTAYCVNPQANRIVWKASPDGEKAMGANSSSPCVAKGRVYYGTTAGNFHILDAKDGKTVKTINTGWPVVASPIAVNESVYIQTIGAVLHGFDLDGKERWRWDHYQRGIKPDTTRTGSPDSFESPHYAGARELCASGRKIVAACGWDFFCLEDEGKDAKVLWCHRAPIGPNKGVPMGMAISGDYVYAACPGVDGAGTIVPFALKDGRYDLMGTKDEWKSKDVLDDQFAVFGTVALRGSTAFVPRHERGFGAFEFLGPGRGWRRKWISHLWTNPAGFTPSLASPALSRDHAAFATTDGEMIIVTQDSRGQELAEFQPAPFRFKTPHGKMIVSSPAIVGGCIYFGCDDGFLYVLGPGRALATRTEKLTLHEPRSKVTPATGKAYAWPCPEGNPANTGAVEDPAFRSPFRLRWAVRDAAVFKQGLTADLESLYFSSMESTVAAVEQATGRIRWRMRIPGVYDHAANRGTVVVSDGRLYLVRALRSKAVLDALGALFCLDARTGETLWERPVGHPGTWTRWAPVCAGGRVVVATIRGEKMVPTVEAFDAEKGTEAWKVPLEEVAGSNLDAREGQGLGGCLLDGRLYYTRAIKGQGLTVALDPANGNVIWKNTTNYGQSGYPSGRDGRLYLGGSYNTPFCCLSAKDGSLVWTGKADSYQAPALGRDCLLFRNYGGSGALSLADGKPLVRNGKPFRMSSIGHFCGPARIVLPHLALEITASGLMIQNLDTGEDLWRSRGFAPRTCASPVISNGRIFANPQSDGMLYCFDPGEM
ncbi:MAG: PQQ-binding-like beta-propeller repeat protein [Planctomycetota bacterium]